MKHAVLQSDPRNVTSAPKLRNGHKGKLALVSLFCGPGGFDAGFRQAGFMSLLAIDAESAACRTFRRNYPGTAVYQEDLSELKRGFITDRLLEIGNATDPVGVIGGPPCQAFSLGNGHKSPDDPRARLPIHYAAILKELNLRIGLDFFVFENVLGIKQKRHHEVLQTFRRLFRGAGFNIFEGEMNAADFGVPQIRKRLFIVGLNRDKYADTIFEFPKPLQGERLTVRDKLFKLPAPAFFERGLRPDQIPFHENHWCMTPRSARFCDGSLVEGQITGRPFRVLSWDRPSWTVAYGHREVHIHPGAKRRLSVYEAMLLQGFPSDYVLKGTLSDQIRMVSDAVSPPVAKALALAILKTINAKSAKAREFGYHFGGADRNL
jgi:DNA (cytosine-5)-methyltransferase 1